MAKLVSKVYGDALFSLAVEENRVDELWDETLCDEAGAFGKSGFHGDFGTS